MLSNRRIRQLANAGNRARLESYIRENSRKANDRMRNIEKHRTNRRGYVYGIARETLDEMDRTRFGSNLSSLTMDELEKQALTLNNYLRAKTSTLRGVVTRENRILRKLRRDGYNVKNPDLFFKILDSDMVSEYADIESGEVMQSATLWANADDWKILDAIEKAEKEYQANSEVYIDDAFKLIKKYKNEIDFN